MKFTMLTQLIEFLQEQLAVSQESITPAIEKAEDPLDLLFFLHQRKAISFEQFDRACEWLCSQA
jgi:Protein of unknown function (DUF2949)